MRKVSEFGILPDHLVKIDLEGEPRPHFYPQEFVVVESRALVVGDEIGVRVASYPYESYHQQEDGSFFFKSPIGNFTLSNGPLA